MEVVGGVKSEIKSEVQVGVVEIGPNDIFNNDSDAEKDPFDLEDKIFREKKDDQLENVKFNMTHEEAKETKQISSNIGKKVIYEDKNRNLRDKKSLQTEERLLLNYTKNEDLFDDSNMKKLQEVRDEVNRAISWSEAYRTFEGTPLNEDHAKIKKKSVPTSFVSPTEYTKEDNKFRCTHCQLVTNTKKNISKHIRYLHRAVTKTYECPYCPFKSKYYPRYHIISMHKPESELTWFRCNQCDYKSKLKSTLTHHLISHLDPNQMIDRMKKCDKCPKMFKNKCALNKHILFIHERQKLKNLKCQECDYTSPLLAELKNHVEICHSDFKDLKTRQCPKCPFKTKIKKKFVNHMSLNHGGTIQCEKCAYQAKSMDKMKLHLITHKEIKDDADLKYRCDKCDYKTYRIYSLQVHKLNHLKPEEIQYFYCYHCSFKAKRKDNLKTHVLRHFKQNEVTLACYLCDFTTKKRHLLVGHVDNHSKEINKGNKDNAPVREESKQKENITSKRSSTQQSRKRKRMTRVGPSKVKQSQKSESLKTKAIASVDKQSLEEVINPKVEPTSTPPTDKSVNESKKLKVECLGGNKKPKLEFIPLDSPLFKLNEAKTE